MKTIWTPATGIALLLCASCSVVEQSSMHGFESGYYTVKEDTAIYKKAYLQIEEDSIRVFTQKSDTLQLPATFCLSLTGADSICNYPFTFRRQSLDIDITSILLKYRPGKQGLPSEFTADFNAALYSGWRWDYFSIKSKKDPFQNCRKAVSSRGFDIGAFAGLGTTPVNSFSTLGLVADDYSGMIFQYGLAAFVETTFVSFGISAGFDSLLTPDKKSWIYQNKLWWGFVVGIALN
jgi:hypothetical protein